MNRVWPRPALITVAALVAVVAVGVVTHAPQETGGCVAPAGAEQQDLDPDDSPEAAWPHTAGERVVVHFAVAGLPDRYAALVGEAAGIWARSPCVEPVVVDACPAEANCSTVVARERGEDDDTDGESDSDDRGGVRRLRRSADRLVHTAGRRCTWCAGCTTVPRCARAVSGADRRQPGIRAAWPYRSLIRPPRPWRAPRSAPSACTTGRAAGCATT